MTSRPPSWQRFPAARRGTIARANPSRAASRRRRSRPPTARSSPSRPTSPMATVAGSIGRSRSDEASARASGRSRPGSATRQPAGEVGVDVVRAEADPGAPAEDGDQQAEPVRVDARRPCGAGVPYAGGRDQRLDLDEQRPAAFERRRDDAAPARRRSCSARNARAGSATSRRPRRAISKTPTSSVEPNRFFVARRMRSVAVAVALERRARRRRGAPASSGRRACRPWSRGRRARPATPSAFASAIRRTARFADLADAPGRPVELVDGRRSAPSRRRECRASRPGDLDDPVDVVLGQDADGVADGAVRAARGARPAAGPARPTPRRSRTAPVRPSPASPRRLQQERRLADARLAAEQHERAGHEPAAEDPVELPDAGRRARRRPRRRRRPAATGAAPTGGHAGREPAARGALADDGLDEGVPAAAGAALALPAEDGSRRRTGRRSDSGRGPRGRRPVAAVRLRRASSRSAARIVRPASGSRSTTIVVARLVAAEQQVLRQRVLDQVLDRRGAAAGRRRRRRSRA